MSPDATLIEVGAKAEDGDLRLWLAREALRQGEIRCSGQMAMVAAYHARALATLGWSVTIALALGAAVATGQHGALAAACGAGSAILAAFCCLAVMWPRHWSTPGHSERAVMDMAFSSELLAVESLALGCADSSEQNSAQLLLIGKWLAAAWAFFAFIPAVAALAYLPAF